MSFLKDLTQKGIIKESDLPEIIKRANQKYKGNLDNALVEFGMTIDKILEFKGAYYNLPVKIVDPKTFSPAALKYVPEDSAMHYKFIPIRMSEGALEVGVIDPENIQTFDALQFISAKLNIPFKIFLISQSDFDSVMASYKGLGSQIDKALGDYGEDGDKKEDSNEIIIENQNTEVLKPGEEERIVEDAPIVKIVSVIMGNAIEGNASDIHIENTGTNVRVRFRVDGILHTSLTLPPNVYAGVVARIKILSKLRLDEKRKPQDGGFSARVEGRRIDFRVSTLPTYYGEKVVMRILDHERGVKPLDKLGLSPDNLATIREAIGKPYGLILITGPTGSGKTTTLYSMLNEIDREKVNVVSLEDPVEYHIPSMNQSQVMPEIGYTFASGLRSILRQDPDVIMVGEIRDKETAQLAIQAALTGHLVFSTLHTNNAIGAVPRLVDMGIDPYLISPTLILTIAQRLVRTIYPGSKNAVPMTEEIRKMIDKQFEDLPAEFRAKIPLGDKTYEPVPTPECPTGLKGRIAVYEMYKTDKDVQNVILKNPTENEIYKIVRKKGMLSMKEDGILKSLQGEVPFIEVYGL